MQRFAILIHRGHGPEHFDMLLEAGDVLATWQFEVDPTVAGPDALPCRRIADHRKAYLDYEGPVSGDRGEVRRIEAGTWQPQCTDQQYWRFDLHGRAMKGVYELQAVSGREDQWELKKKGASAKT